MLCIAKYIQLRTRASSFVFRRLLKTCQTNNCKSKDPPLGSRIAVWLDSPVPPKHKPPSRLGRKIGQISPEARLRAMMEDSENSQHSATASTTKASVFTESLDNYHLVNKDSSFDNPPENKDMSFRDPPLGVSFNEPPVQKDLILNDPPVTVSSPVNPPTKPWSASRRRSLSPLSRVGNMVAGDDKGE